ncbi:hypothetical protein D3C72_601610 [compost metagenome]
MSDHRLEGDHDQPTQGNVQDDPEPAADARQEQLSHGPEDRKAPHRSRHAPRPGAGETVGGERRVGAGDHQEDARVIETTQKRAPPGRCEIIGG